MRTIPCLMLATLLSVPLSARAQTFELYGAAGPTITDPGYSFAAGFGVSPTPKFTVLANVERTHLSTQTQRRDTGSISTFRGGTYLLGSGELRFVPFGNDRVGPFVLAGFAAGTSRPNVTSVFPTAVTNDARAVFAGGGILVPIGRKASAFVDARMMFGVEGVEGIVAVAPVRAGLAWRF